jgi:hypothetical protein
MPGMALRFSDVRTGGIPPQISTGTKPRRGCLGCLWQTLWQCTLILGLGAILLIAMTGLFYPWAFYLGGRFHILPYWQGWGKLHAKSGDYLLFVSFEPTPRGSKMYLETNLTGTAYVCTPRGERIRLRMGGGMRKHLKLSTDGEAIHLYMNYWPWNANFISDHNPSLEFRGHWQNPNLMMDDHSSIARAFQPDGSVYHGQGENRPYMTEIVPITLTWGSYSQFKQACAAKR